MKPRHLQDWNPDWDPKARGSNGRGLCKWCLAEVPRGRQCWCSQKCVDDYSIRSNPGFARCKVWERDRGVCAICGLDTSRVQRVLQRLLQPRYGWTSENRIPNILKIAWPARFQRLRTALIERGFDFGHGTNYSGSYWQADHIVPVVEGGGACGLDNLRTLCTPCHKAETRGLRARLAKPKELKPLAPGSCQFSLF